MQTRLPTYEWTGVYDKKLSGPSIFEEVVAVWLERPTRNLVILKSSLALTISRVG